MVSEHEQLAAYFDRWYADMADAPLKDRIQQRHLGLPPQLLSTSLLTWTGMAEVAEALSLAPGDLLVDLACGRGGYGQELAARSGARLLGVDFAPSALDSARTMAARSGLQADYEVGDLVATGLPPACADGVLVVDAIQFPADPAAAYDEIARILRPGGRVVVTCWEAVDRNDPEVPERIRQVALEEGLGAAGFLDVEVHDKPDWRSAERAMWTEAASIDPGDDPALRSFHDEGVRSLATFDRLRRVLATATR